MANDVTGKSLATAEQKRRLWKRILWIIGIALTIFGGEQLRPVSRILDAVGPAVVDELIPMATATPTPVPSPTPVQESAVHGPYERAPRAF